MSKRMLRKVSDFISEAKREEFAREVADRRWPDNDSVADAYGKIGYIRGLTEAMLTQEDIKLILTLYHNVIGDGIENIYPEVLKRFNEIKFKK